MTYGQNSVTPGNEPPDCGARRSFGPAIPGRAIHGEYHHTGRVTVFRDGSVTLAACDFAIFAEGGYSRADFMDDKPSRRRGSGAGNIERAIRRARAEMRTLIRNNPLPWFVTLTLDKERIDRYDAREIVRRVGYWCDNAVRRKGLAYCLVPEYHQDGAIHYHGFFNDALSMVDSGHEIGGRAVFNCPDWPFGFSACERVEDNGRALAYALKYVGKGREKIGGRWWYHGGALAAPLVFLADLDAGALLAQGGHAVHIDRLGCDLVLMDLKPGEYEAGGGMLPCVAPGAEPN